MPGFGAIGHTAIGAVPGPGAAQGSNPPFAHPARSAAFAAIVAAWQPPAPQPHIGGREPLKPAKLNPALIAVEVDEPPYEHRARSRALQVLGAWLTTPDRWVYDFLGAGAPYASLKAAPGIPGQSIDNPPFWHPSRTPAAIALASTFAQPEYAARPWIYDFLGGGEPYASLKAAPGIPGQSIDNPPFRHPSRTPAAIALASTFAQPEYAARPWIYDFLGAGEPYASLKAAPGIPGQSIDNPPFVGRRYAELVNQLAVSWRPPPPSPWTPRYTVKFTASFTMLLNIG